MKVKKIDLTNVVGIKELIKYKKLKHINNKNDIALKVNKDYLKEKFKFDLNNSNNNNIKKVNEDSKNDIKMFNKTFNNKSFLSRKNIKEVSFKLNDVSKIKEEPDDEPQIKKLMRNFSSNSKESTMYKTKKKFCSSSQLKNRLSSDEKNRNYIRLNSSRKNSFFGRKLIRSFSANNLIDKNIIGSGQSAFITAVNNPLINHRNDLKKRSDNSNKSYFFNKIKSEKKFLTFYDIKKIYFLDKKVYKPNKEFEKEVNKLKRNNSNEFITNFNFDIYKMTILNLFQKQVSYHNFDIMKKNFDVINKGWKWKDNLKCHVRNRKRISTSQTEREMIYSQNKIDRENRIKMRSNNLLKNQK